MTTQSILALSILSASIFVAGCQAPGEQYQASVYQADQLNQKQAAKTINIIAVLPAKVEVDNSQARNDAQKAGLLLGGIAGALLGNGHGSDGALVGGLVGGVAGGVTGSVVSDKTIVDGVSITYAENNKIFTSTQIGHSCEFHPGVALVISTKKNETRVQPNGTCPTQS